MSKKAVRIGTSVIGGGAPIAVQSMTTTDTCDIDATVEQIVRLEEAGCDIVRVALYDEQCVLAIPCIKKQIQIPLVGDVHFDWRIAVAACDAGIDKIRINPGNIGSAENIRSIADAANANGVPIRVGANSGSLRRGVGRGSSALVLSTLENIEILEECRFDDIVVSVKSSDVRECVEAARELAKVRPYPLHLGVTEAGTYEHAVIKSATGIGTLLIDGIGDTIRFSISGDPVREVAAAHELLGCLRLEEQPLEVISCPTCARCGIDVEQQAQQIETSLADRCEFPVRIAVMGCVVNGPGEARQADIGIAGGRGKVSLFTHGRVVATCAPERAFEAVAEALDEYQAQRRKEYRGNKQTAD